MILDGYWKLELKKSIDALRFWRKVAGGLHTDFADHQVNGRHAPLDEAVQKVGQSVKIHCLI